MIRVALRGLAGRKLRAALTALAIVLGVAMVSGTYILTDTINRAFDTLFSDVYTGVDAVIEGKEAFETDFGLPPSFSESLLDEVKALPDVEAAVGGITDVAQLTDRSGEAISTGGAPTLAFGYDAARYTEAEQRFNPLVLTAGRWPSGPREITIDAGTAESEDYAVGDAIGVAARGPLEQFTIVGVAKFGSVDSIGGATLAIFDLRSAQALFHKEGKLDGISAAAKPGVSPEELVGEIRAILPPGTEAKTGVAQASEDSADVEEFTSFIQYFLLAFGGIALFVGAFVIFNTLSITVAQRTREFATLRTIGASRRQVLGSVVVEALVIGVLASVAGLFLGFGLAKGLNSVFVSFGIDLPKSGTVFLGRTVVVSLVLGIAITLVAGLFPAIRATRVPPISAVREGAILPKSRLAPFTPYVAMVAVVLGIAGIVAGMFVSNLSTAQVLVLLAVGVLVLFLGIALVARHLVRPIVAVLGIPAARFGGAAGRLARENSLRNTGRTAATAAALMIGLALITFVAVLAQGLRQSVGEAIDEQVHADYVLVSEDGFTPFEPGPDSALAAVAETRVVGVRGDRGRAFGDETDVTGISPAGIAEVYDFAWREGSDAALGVLGSDGAVVEKEFAEDHALGVGSSFRLETPSGRTIGLTVKGIYAAPSFWKMLGAVSIPTETFDSAFENPRNLYTFVNTPGGASASTTRALERALEPFPGVELDTREGFKQNQQDSINTFLNLLYVLLALSVIVSFFGMVNTLVLSVFERTRELGLLRAVGMTRRQTRRMVRHESIITALIGAALGMPLGILLAALVTTRLSSEGLGFAVPWLTLVVFALAAAAVGVVAAVFPARRAARLNVLEALQYE